MNARAHRIWSIAVAMTLLLGLVAALPLTGSAGPGANSVSAKMCQKGGWRGLQGSDGTRFASEQECVSYGAQGGTIIPIPTATPTPTNTPTATPMNTPEPTATNTPEPTATNTPEPTATNTPIPPTATNTPEPTATNTPVPPTATPDPNQPSLDVVFVANFARGAACDVYAVLANVDASAAYDITMYYEIEGAPIAALTTQTTTDANGDAQQYLRTHIVGNGPFWLKTTHNGQPLVSEQVTTVCSEGPLSLEIWFTRTADPSTCNINASLSGGLYGTTYTVEWWNDEGGTAHLVQSTNTGTSLVGEVTISFGTYQDDASTLHWAQMTVDGQTISTAHKPVECDPPPGISLRSNYTSDPTACEVHVRLHNLTPNQTYSVTLLQDFNGNGTGTSTDQMTTDSFGDANELFGYVGSSGLIFLTVTTTHEGQLLSYGPALNCRT